MPMEQYICASAEIRLNCNQRYFTMQKDVNRKNLSMLTLLAEDMYNRSPILSIDLPTRISHWASFSAQSPPHPSSKLHLTWPSSTTLRLGYNVAPIPSQIPRPSNLADTTPIDEVLEAEQLDSDGNPENPRKSVKRKRPSKSKSNAEAKPTANSGPDDSDFGTGESDGASSGSDSDIEEVLPNAELADFLPTKTIPENSRRRRTNQPPQKKSKDKAKATDPPPDSSTPSTPVQPSTVPKKRKAPKPRNTIYYFFKEVDQNADGSVEEGARYYKCYLGNRKVFKIGRKMSHNTYGLQSHLQLHFLAHYRLFKILNSRDTPPTDVELALARGSTPMTPEKTAEYLEQLDLTSKNIKEMFENQAAALEARYLLAKWGAACDQPVPAVDAVEFRVLETEPYVNISAASNIVNSSSTLIIQPENSLKFCTPSPSSYALIRWARKWLRVLRRCSKRMDFK
ncbi:hypothetical protein B0H14DRAFT_2633920 [Mycena olivaceomarginata]|nr:hypothetical protein B0H14DRAFT_2633920 [Mycena olivaceomarginata]